MTGVKHWSIWAILAIMAMLVFAPVNLGAQETAPSEEAVADEPPPSLEADPCISGEAANAATLLPPEKATEEEPAKRIIISLADQTMWVFENDSIVHRFPVSTGRPGHPTPPGKYSVHSRSPRAYSRKYECYMLHWMAITGDGQIGMHSLEGHSYERHLGHVASHGCIRLSHENAQWLYEWVEIGTPVEIVNDWEEPVEPEVLAEYPFHW